MRERDDEDDELQYGRPEFPRAVQIAGIIWIVIGSLILLNAAAGLLLTFGTVGGGADRAGGVCPMLIGVLFAAVFLHVGIQSTRGTAKDTLGNGIGSILFGLPNAGFGVILIGGAAVAGRPVGLILVLLGIVCLLAAVGLLAAGVLALVGRQQYKAWRRAQKNRFRAARVSDEDDDEYWDRRAAR